MVKLVDMEQDSYVCPNGCVLKFSSFKKGKGAKRYSAKVSDCRSCSIKSQCLRDKVKARQLEHSCHQTQYEKQHENDTSDDYKSVQRLRKIWCERNFSHQKARHCMSRAKMRGIVQTKGQCLLSACAVNIKRMVSWLKSTSNVPTKPLISLKIILKQLIRPFVGVFYGVCQQLQSTTHHGLIVCRDLCRGWRNATPYT